MKNLIPNIEQKINKVLKELKIKPKVSPKEFIKKTRGRKHRYLAICRDEKGKKLIFYARLHKNPDARRKMMAEILFLKKLKEKEIEISKYIPKLYQSKIEKDFEWFTREHITGFLLGTNEQLKRDIKKEGFLLLVKAIYRIKQTPFSSFNLKKFSEKNYFDSQDSLPFLLERKVLNKQLVQKIKKAFQENERLLKKENRCFSHGDFNLGNLIVSRGSLKILDWESIQINNFTFDIAYFFTHLWQAKKEIRRKLIQNYLNLLSLKEKITFRKIFPLVIFYLAVGGIEAKPAEIPQSLLKKRRQFFEKLLKNAPLGTDNLMNV
ncbi:hypothetical protein AMJ50_00275 [Parcubacteria bacterium DG_74_3]|nr:MAG: hypothetical protein AMJ50_00275 [Parcubacteria bacterium DG_74_3]